MEFVPAADDVGRLQRGKDEECAFFQRISEQGHYAGRTVPSATRQGIYAAAPSGVLLSSVNTRRTEAIAKMLEDALGRWKDLPREERLLPQAPGRAPARWEDLYPEDGLVLRVHSRDLPREKTASDWRAKAWNRDHAWFTKAEARAFVPVEARPGATAELPGVLVDRVARLHLVDNVRGQVAAFPEGSVERGRIATRIREVEGTRILLEISGETRAGAKGRWPVRGFADEKEPEEQGRGFDARLAGRAAFEVGEERFVAFELVAIGERWGGTQFNGRGDDLEPSPIGVFFTLAGEGDRVAPAAIARYGWAAPGRPRAATGK